MGKLAALRKRLEPPEPEQDQVDLRLIAEQVVGDLWSDMRPELQTVAKSLQGVQGEVTKLPPSVKSISQQMTSYAIQEISRKIEPEMRALAEELRSRSITQKDMLDLQKKLVGALSNVRIPDYSVALARLETKQPDLSGIMERLDALRERAEQEPEAEEHDEPPRQWTFRVQRDGSGLIQTITAEAN